MLEPATSDVSILGLECKPTKGVSTSVWRSSTAAGTRRSDLFAGIPLRWMAEREAVEPSDSHGARLVRGSKSDRHAS